MKKSFYLFVLLLVYAITSSATVYYVSPNGNDSSSGLSWATARATIQSAIDSATIGDSVFVAIGNYYGFTIKSGVHVFGGFLGFETNLNQRQPLSFGFLPNNTCSNIGSSISSSQTGRIRLMRMNTRECCAR